MADFTEILAKSRRHRSYPSPERRRAIREAAMLTQVDIAETIGVSRAMVSRWEAGLRGKGEGKMAEYMELLDVLANDLEATLDKLAEDMQGTDQ